MSNRSGFRVLAVLAACAAQTPGQTCPFDFTHLADQFAHTCTEVAPGVWDLTLTVTEDNVGTVKVESQTIATGGSPRIGELRMELTDPDPATPAHVGLILRGTIHNPANLAGLERVTPVSSTGVELAILELIVNGDVGHLTASRIYDATILGSLTGGIDLPEARDQGPQEVSAFIHSLTIMGDLLGPIEFHPDDELQHIDWLIVGGNIGNAAAPFELFVNAIGSVRCHDLNARLGSFGLGQALVQGQMNAPISAIDVKPGLLPDETGEAGVFIGGNAKNSLTISGGFDGDIGVGGFVGDGVAFRIAELPAGRSVSIGGDIKPAASVVIEGLAAGSIEIGGALDGVLLMKRGFDGTATLSAGGLRGQVTIQSQGGLYAWNGVVGVGADELAPTASSPFEAPYYQANADYLGGGAIGLVPFRVHDADSIPANGAVVDAPDAMTEVRIVHYGPVRIAQPGQVACVRIERRAWVGGSSAGAFVDVTDRFDPADIVVSSLNPRELVINGPFDCWSEYRITPVGTQLLCDLGNGVPVAAYEYGFTLRYCGR